MDKLIIEIKQIKHSTKDFVDIIMQAISDDEELTGVCRTCSRRCIRFDKEDDAFCGGWAPPYTIDKAKPVIFEKKAKII